MTRSRNTYLGGTDIAAICGVSAWATARDVWERKTGRSERPAMTETMYWGLRLEDAILDEWTVRGDGRRIDDRQVHLRSDRHPCLGGTADAIGHDPDGGPVLLEAKKIGAAQRSSWAREIPIDYRYQMTYYCALAGLRAARAVVLFGGSEWQEFRLAYDAAEGERLLEVGERWWRDYVVADVPPPEPEPEQADGIEVSDAPGMGDLLREWCDVQASRKALDARKDELEAELRELSAGRALLWRGTPIASTREVQRRETIVPASSYTAFALRPAHLLRRTLEKT